MTLAAINWATLTEAQAKRLVDPANRREQALAAQFDASGSPEAEAAWLEAFTLWEDLRVYALCGVKPDR